MKAADLVTTAVANTFRSRTRTILTVLAIFVGAFTLTITNGLGVGINRYIDTTVASIGADDVMTVSKAGDSANAALPGGASGPAEYDPDAVATGIPGAPGGGGGTVAALTPEVITAIEAIDGVVRVEPTRSISPDFVQHDGGTRFVSSVGTLVPGQTFTFAAGGAPDASGSASEAAIPVALVEPLGFASADDAIGATITVGITDPERVQHEVEATITGVVEESLTGSTGVIPNAAFADALLDVQNAGIPAEQLEKFASAGVWFDPAAGDDATAALKDRLADAGYSATTVADQLGTFTSVIDAIVLVLNAFAVVALLAAGFGIVNTLLMSVQERTREIGLMKAMGMGGGRIFSLFSLEAVFIGFLGSAIGAVVAIGVGTAVSAQLATGLFSNLAGLTLIAFDPASIVTTMLLIMGLAFAAGTLPALRAASADPVTSLRYE